MADYDIDKYHTCTISTRVVIDMETMEVVERDSYQYSGPLELCIGVIGTGVSSPTAQLINTLDSIGQKLIYPSLGDITFKPSPTFWALTRNGKKFSSGAEIVYPLVTIEEPTGGAYYGDQLLNTAVIDSIQPANQVWRAYYQAVSIPVTDIILGRGGPAGLDLVKVKMQVGAASFLQKLSRAIWGTAPQNTSLDIDSLPAWVQQTSNTIAGISRSTLTAWQPAANQSAGSAHLSVATAETAYQAVTYGYDEPDTLLLSNTDYGNFKIQFTSVSSTTTSLIRYFENEQDKAPVQTSIRYHFRFNNCVVLADQFISAGTGYMLNSRYLWPLFNSNSYFRIRPWIAPSNQDVIVSTMHLVWQLGCNSPRMQIAITNIS